MLNGIDDGMHLLIKAMNEIEYIETFSCCEGHPEETAVSGYGYAVANIIFEIIDEPHNLITWMTFAQHILRQRKRISPENEFAYIIEKKFSLNTDGNLGWDWEVKIQATGESPEECRMGLDEGVAFLTKMCVEEREKNLT